MPTYQYKCRKCGKEWEGFHHIKYRHDETCCEERATIVPSRSATHLFKPFMSQELAEQEIYIDSKRQYREELKKRHLMCEAVGVTTTG